MAENVDAIELDKQLKELIGYGAQVEVTENGARQSAGKIVDLEEKLLLKTTTSKDLQDAAWPVLQLVTRYKNARKEVANGARYTLEDRVILDDIKEKFSRANLSKEEMKRLTSLQYLADPMLGASKAMEVFQKLHSLHPAVELKQAAPPKAQ